MDQAREPEIAIGEAYFVETILKEISDVVSSIDDAQQVMGRLVRLATTLLNVNTCSLIMLDPVSEEMRIRAAHGLNEEVVRSFRQRVGEGITGHVAKTGMPLLIEDVETHPLFRRKSRKHYRTTSLLSVPLIQNREVIGVLNVNNRKDGGVFTRSDELLLSVLANFMVIAIDKAQMREKLIRTERYEAELRVARRIQEEVLLGELPRQPNWEFAIRNVPAQAVAGDFFDAIPLPGNHTCLVLGDVCGKGVPAALYMARVLGYFRVAARVRNTAGDIMSFVNDLLADEWTEQTFVTAAVCVLDGADGKLAHCSAGHLKPFRRRAKANTVEVLPAGHDPPLGIDAGISYEVTEVETAPGDVLVLYTDGVIEAKNRAGKMLGEERFKRLIGEHRGSSEALAGAVIADIERFAEGQPQADDITLLVMGRV